jgi:hypothetical protein
MSKGVSDEPASPKVVKTRGGGGVNFTTTTTMKSPIPAKDERQSGVDERKATVKLPDTSNSRRWAAAQDGGDSGSEEDAVYVFARAHAAIVFAFRTAI